MTHSRLGALGIDCREGELAEHARFWAAALGYQARPPQPGDDRYIHLDGPEGEVALFVQRVEHEPRVHLDIETDDIEAEVKRLEGLGAKLVARIRTWVVMEAPSGHRFCVVRPQRADFPGRAEAR